jgi:uncharacterized membrane protein YqaE (UPF0057 family)
MGWNEVLNSLLGLYDFAIHLGDLVGKIISLIPKIFELIAMLADPGKLIKDLLYGLKTGIYLIFNSVLDLFFGNLSDKFKHNFNNDNKKEKEDCVKPSFLEIIILVLCPPLAIFIRKGMKGFLTILITTILTCFYYLPGVLFASLHIL